MGQPNVTMEPAVSTYKPLPDDVYPSAPPPYAPSVHREQERPAKLFGGFRSAFATATSYLSQATSKISVLGGLGKSISLRSIEKFIDDTLYVAVSTIHDGLLGVGAGLFAGFAVSWYINPLLAGPIIATTAGVMGTLGAYRGCKNAYKEVSRHYTDQPPLLRPPTEAEVSPPVQFSDGVATSSAF